MTHSIINLKTIAILLLVIFMVTSNTGCAPDAEDSTSPTDGPSIPFAEPAAMPTEESTKAPEQSAGAPESIPPTEETIVPDASSPAEDTEPMESPTQAPKDTYPEVEETVYAVTSVNIRTGPGTVYEIVGALSFGQSIQRVGISDNGWSRVLYNGELAYMYSEYLSTTKPADSSIQYPIQYSDATCTITITKEWYENAYCYIAHLQFSDYSRFGTACANGRYDNGYETTSNAAKRLSAIFAVNGCYSAPYLNYGVVRSGVVCNDGNCRQPGVYSSATGALGSPEAFGVNGQRLSDLAAAGMVTDTFCFGPAFLVDGQITADPDTGRAQRTFIGTNGNPGDIWIVVSEGRYADGQSAGLTHAQCARLLAEKGCTFGVPLDGGGSSTMVFQGQILNSAKINQRAVVDFVYFR